MRKVYIISRVYIISDNMAKPIRATPVLKGKDAINFVRNMIKEQNSPSKDRINFIDNALRKKDYYLKNL